MNVINTFAGPVNIKDGVLSKFKPVVIPHALSQICRFAGQCPFFYSVAEHSALVGLRARQLAGDEAYRWGLLHDASEAFVGDVPGPVKAQIPDFEAFEGMVQVGIRQQLEMGDASLEARKAVEQADREILNLEFRHVMDVMPPFTELKDLSAEYEIVGMSSPKAFRLFFRHLKEAFPHVVWE